MNQFELNVIFSLFYNHSLYALGIKKMGPGYKHLVIFYDASLDITLLRKIDVFQIREVWRLCWTIKCSW